MRLPGFPTGFGAPSSRPLELAAVPRPGGICRGRFRSGRAAARHRRVQIEANNKPGEAAARDAFGVAEVEDLIRRAGGKSS